MYGPMAHQYAGNEVAAALTPGSNEGSAHGKLHHSTNNSRVVLCPFFFNNFSVVSVCDFAKKKKATNAGVCCYSCCACFDISLLFSLYIDQCCYRCFWTSLGYLFLISLRPQTLLIDY